LRLARPHLKARRTKALWVDGGVAMTRNFFTFIFAVFALGAFAWAGEANQCDGHGINPKYQIEAGEAIQAWVTANSLTVSPGQVLDIGRLTVGNPVKFYVGAYDNDAHVCQIPMLPVRNFIADSQVAVKVHLSDAAGNPTKLLMTRALTSKALDKDRAWEYFLIIPAEVVPEGESQSISLIGKQLLFEFSGTINDVKCTAPKHAASDDTGLSLDEQVYRVTGSVGINVDIDGIHSSGQACPDDKEDMPGVLLATDMSAGPRTKVVANNPLVNRGTLTITWQDPGGRSIRLNGLASPISIRCDTSTWPRVYVVTTTGHWNPQDAVAVTLRHSDDIAEDVVRLVTENTRVGRIQYESKGAWLDVPFPLHVKKGSSVRFKAIADPEGSQFPVNKPVWRGYANGKGQIITVSFPVASNTVDDLRELTAECENYRTANILVEEFAAGSPPTGERCIIKDGPGDLSVRDNAYWMLKGGRQNFSVKFSSFPTDGMLIDVDRRIKPTPEEDVYDTFTGQQALHWRSSRDVPIEQRATFAPEFGANATWMVPAIADRAEDWVALRVKDDGKYYEDVTAEHQVASFRVHLFGYEGVDSVLAEDITPAGDARNRKHHSYLEVVGGADIRFSATPKGQGQGGQFPPGYPIWTVVETGDTKNGATVEFGFSAPKAVPLSWTSYNVTCKGSPDSEPVTLRVRAYAGAKESLQWDFRKYGDDAEKLLKTFKAFSQASGGEITLLKPNGTAQAEFSWQELSNSNQAILCGYGNVGLHPLIGINVDVLLYGMPSFIEKYFQAGGGVYFTIGGWLDIAGEAGRRPNSAGTAGEPYGGITGAATIEGGLKAKAALTKYVYFELLGKTKVTVSCVVAADSVGLGARPSGEWGGLDVTIKAKIIRFEYSRTWNALPSAPLFESDTYYLKKWNGA
jgi:hypothetical protein